MKFRKSKHLIRYFLLLALSAIFIFGCKRGNAELGTKATASFIIMPVAGKVNTYLV